MKTKAQLMWEVSKEVEEEFIKRLPREIFNEEEIFEFFKLIRGSEYRRGKEDGRKEKEMEN